MKSLTGLVGIVWSRQNTLMNTEAPLDHLELLRFLADYSGHSRARNPPFYFCEKSLYGEISSPVILTVNSLYSLKTQFTYRNDYILIM